MRIAVSKQQVGCMLRGHRARRRTPRIRKNRLSEPQSICGSWSRDVRGIRWQGLPRDGALWHDAAQVDRVPATRWRVVAGPATRWHVVARRGSQGSRAPEKENMRGMLGQRGAQMSGLRQGQFAQRSASSFMCWRLNDSGGAADRVNQNPLKRLAR